MNETRRAGTPGALRLAAGVSLLTWAAVHYANRVPTAVPAYAVPREFSAGRATSHVQRLTQHTHPVGSLANTIARGYLLGELRVLGLQPVEQTTTAVGTRYAAAGRVTNVLARLPGTQPGGKAVLLMAHYDAVPAAPGAGDDASGVATLLETLRVLRSGPRLRNDVIALFTDGEEAGLLGAAAFAREHPWSKDVAVAMNFEGRGTRGPSLMFETGPGNLDVIRFLRGVRGARATSLSTDVYRRLPNDTDLSELAILDVPALNFAFIGGVDRYHTAQDDPIHLDPRSVQHHGDQAVALTRAFANGPLPRPKTSDAVFFDFPWIGLVVYPTSFALAFAIVAFVLCAAVVARGRGMAGWGAGVALGMLTTIVAVLLGAVTGYGLAMLLQRLHQALRSGTPEWSGIYALAVALSVVAVTLAVLTLASRRIRTAAVSAGALVVWTLLAVWVSIAAPGASFLFVWPLLAVAAASLMRPDSTRGRLARWIATAIVVFVVAPTTYLMACVALGVNQIGSTLIGLLGALAVTLLAGLFETSETRSGTAGDWLGSALAAAAALVLFVVGAATVRTNADHPAGASLVYAIEPDSAGAWLTGYASSPTALAILRHFLGEALPMSGGTTAPSAPPTWLRRYASAGSVPVQRTDFPRSEATILSDSTVASERRMTIRFRPGPGVQTVLMAAESGSVLRATVDSKPVETNRYRSTPRQWNLAYYAPPDSGFVLGLALPAASHTTLGFSTRSEGLPPLRLPPRPQGIVPYQAGNTTVMYYRLRL